MKFKLHHKTPLPLVLGLVLNLVLIIAIEVLAFYRRPVEMTPQDFAGYSSRYENCTILDAYDGKYYLVRTQEGETDLIPTQSHSLLPSRTRISSRKIITLEDPENSRSVKIQNGLMFDTVTVSQAGISQISGFGTTQTSRAAFAVYFLFAGILTFCELFILEKIKGNI